MSLTIGIDASRAVKKNRTGPENYSYEIIRAILALPTNHQFILYAPNLPIDHFPLPSTANWRILPPTRLWSQIRLGRAVNTDSPDIFFVPSHVIPIISRVPAVVTIHDLAFKYFPESYSRTQRYYQNFTTGVSVAKAKRVIVPSKSTEQDLIKFYPTAKGKTVIIPHGYNRETFKPADDKDKSPQKVPYIFYVGRIEEKKNIRLLVDAFALLCKEKKEINLVLAGKNGYGFEIIQAHIQSLPAAVRSRIYQPGHLPSYDLIRYFQHAAIFAFPSRYEGFGLSVLEAMACGVPIVCSNNSSLPEVTGDGAVLLPPTNALSWAAAFSRIINQPQFRQDLITKALKQANQFSWPEAAKKTLKTIEDAVS